MLSITRLIRNSEPLQVDASYRLLASLSKVMNYKVEHDKKAKEFRINLADLDSDTALLQYEKEGKNILDLWHTEVPLECRGKGIAGHLAKAALDYAVTENMKVRLSCTYLQKYVKENPVPKYTERVVP